MSKLFFKYGEIFYDEDEYLITPDLNYKIGSRSLIKKISDFNQEYLKNFDYSIDFIDTENPNYLLYIVFKKIKERYDKPETTKQITYLFFKNKLYDFDNKGYWYDEMGNVINEYYDIWYDPFVFVKEKDKEKALRYFKLNKLENNI